MTKGSREQNRSNSLDRFCVFVGAVSVQLCMCICVEYKKINPKKNGLKQPQCKHSEVKVSSWNEEEVCPRRERPIGLYNKLPYNLVV